MWVIFGYANTQLTKKYTRKDDLRKHLVQWTKAWGEISQLEWVHIFIHTLDVIIRNWYLEMELRQGTVDWDEMKEIFLLTFSFKDGFECIDEVL